MLLFFPVGNNEKRKKTQKNEKNGETSNGENDNVICRSINTYVRKGKK